MQITFDNNYFNDKFQGIPIGGYNKLIDGLLEGIESKVNTDFFNSEYKDWEKYADKLIYTGSIDQFFEYRFGKLNWCSVHFETETKDCPNYQGNAVVNHTSQDVPYTRVIEHKHFEMFGQEVYDCPKTVISKEYSAEYREGMEPYYPVNDERNNTLAAQYKELAHQEGIIFPEESLPFGGRLAGAVIFGGRLAKYKYYDIGTRC